jgi:hypothetical protein
MGGNSSGGSSGGNKNPGQVNNTGTPAWSSGFNSMSSVGPEPGTGDYNAMNTQLQTNPMQFLTGLFQQGGMGNYQQNAADNLIGSSGTNNWMDQAAQGWGNVAGQGTQNFQNIYDKAGTPGANEQYLTDYAAGKYVGASNPYTESILRKGQDDSVEQLNRMFAGGGRYGSAMNQGTVADSVMNIGNQYRGDQYNKDVANQFAASGAISGEQQGRMGIQNSAAQGVGGMQQAAASGLGGLGQSAFQNWLGAQTGAAGLQQQGIQNMLSGLGGLGAAQANKMFDSTQQRGVGQELDQASQQQLDDLIKQWGQTDMSDWARLGGYQSAAQGAAGNYGTQSGTQKSSQSAGLGSILGGILSIL